MLSNKIHNHITLNDSDSSSYTIIFSSLHLQRDYKPRITKNDLNRTFIDQCI